MDMLISYGHIKKRNKNTEFFDDFSLIMLIV